MPTNHDHAVPSGTTSEERVIAALRVHAGATVAEIATAAGVGRSTAGKILATAEQNGRAQRTPGVRDGKNRMPDRWNAVTPFEANERLGRGALRKMVADYLHSHAGAEFGPTAIGKALDRSSGAVANALTKLAGHGAIVQTSEHPARYAVVIDTPTKDEA